MTEFPEEAFEGFTGGGDTHLADGSFHAATLTELNIIRLPSKWPEYPDGTARTVEWVFVLDEPGPDGGTVTVKGTSSLSVGKKSRAYPWLVSLVGTARADAAGREMIKKAELVGRECTVVIQINDSGYPKVSSVLPSQKGATPAAQQAPKAEQKAAPADPTSDLEDLPW